MKILRAFPAMLVFALLGAACDTGSVVLPVEQVRSQPVFGTGALGGGGKADSTFVGDASTQTDSTAVSP